MGKSVDKMKQFVVGRCKGRMWLLGERIQSRKSQW